MAFKDGVVLGTVSLNATGAGTTTIAGTSNTGTVTIGNTSSGAIAIDCGTAGITVGATANAHSSTFGSTNSTSSTTIQSGSGALNITSTNGAMTLNTGTGTFTASGDNTATAVNIATGAAAKTVIMGSTTTTSSIRLNYGTGGFDVRSPAGSSILGTAAGEVLQPLQPAFLATRTSAVANVTGDGTVYTIVYNAEVFDQNGDFNGTTTFTAPVTGRYQFNVAVQLNDITAGMTSSNLAVVTSNRTYNTNTLLSGVVASSGFLGMTASVLADMDAGDTATSTVFIAGGALVVDVNSGGATDPRTYFSGFLAC